LPDTKGKENKESNKTKKEHNRYECRANNTEDHDGTQELPQMDVKEKDNLCSAGGK